jgi:hypothetical protein
VNTPPPSSSLVRLLAPWAPARPPAPPVDVAERLGQWVGAFDAITLQSTQRAIRAMDTADVPVRPAGPAALPLAQAFEQARATLARAIAQDPALPNETTFAPYKRRHLDLQRQMEQVIGALREHVRESLARTSPALRQLAALDQAMEKLMARREQALLPQAVALLERRFHQLRKEHEARVKAAGLDDDDPIAWRRPGAWLHGFEREWRQALRAELSLRLEPVAGLVEATGTELNDSA